MKFGEYFGPMLLSQIKEPFDDDNYIFELKFDGIRALIHASPKNILIFTRRGTEITDLFPELKSICTLVKENVIFDGEIVLFKYERPNFHELVKRVRMKNKQKIEHLSNSNPVIFMAFDIIYKDKDITFKSLWERKEILKKYPNNENFIKTEYIIKNGKKLFQKIKKLGLEGIVAKRMNSVYQINERVNDWIKIKNYQSGIFYIGGYDIKNVRISLSLGEYQNDKFVFVGKVAVEKNSNVYEKIKKDPIVTKSPFSSQEEKIDKYLKPHIKCKVSFIERTPNNHLREPVFVSLV